MEMAAQPPDRPKLDTKVLAKIETFDGTEELYPDFMFSMRAALAMVHDDFEDAIDRRILLGIENLEKNNQQALGYLQPQIQPHIGESISL